MKKKIIWGIIAVLIIVAALMGILYYTTDLFKSPEQLFYKHLADDVNFLGKTTYADVMKELKKEAEASSKNAGEITAKVTTTDTQTQEIATVLEKGKITYDMKTVGNEKKMQGDITLNYDGKDIVTVNVLQNKEQYGIKVAEAYDKYVSVENNNLKALFQKLGVDTTDIPDKIEMVDYYELLNIDEETLKHIEDTYTGVIKQNIPVESYSVEKNVTVKIDGEDVTTNAYKLTLTEEQTKVILEKVLETLKADDTTLNLIIEKYNMIAEPYKAMGATMSTEVTKDSLVKAIEDELQDLNDTTTNSGNVLEVIVYGTKNSKAKIAMNVVENETNIAKLEMDMTKKNKDKKAIMTCSAEDTTITMIASESEEKTGLVLTASENDNIVMEFVIVAQGNNTEATMKVTSDGTTAEINMKNELKSTENVTVEDFTVENSVKLNDMTQDEISTLVQTIYTNVTKVLPEKAQLLGINL